MKRLLILAVLMAGTSMIANKSMAQVSVNVSINLGSQPEWGPSGYDYVQFYYLPDLDMYYDVPNHRFYYLSANRWRYSTALPPQYRNIDLYSIHKVVVNEKNPFQYHAKYQQQYAQFKNKHDQQPIRDIKEDKYSQSKNNWQNNRFRKPQAHVQPGGRPPVNNNNNRSNDRNRHH